MNIVTVLTIIIRCPNFIIFQSTNYINSTSEELNSSNFYSHKIVWKYVATVNYFPKSLCDAKLTFSLNAAELIVTNLKEANLLYLSTNTCYCLATSILKLDTHTFQLLPSVVKIRWHMCPSHVKLITNAPGV